MIISVGADPSSVLWNNCNVKVRLEWSKADPRTAMPFPSIPSVSTLCSNDALSDRSVCVVFWEKHVTSLAVVGKMLKHS